MIIDKKEFLKLCGNIADVVDLHPEEFLPFKYYEIWEEAEQERIENIQTKLFGEISLEDLEQMQTFARIGELSDMIYCEIQKRRNDE